LGIGALYSVWGKPEKISKAVMRPNVEYLDEERGERMPGGHQAKDGGEENKFCWRDLS